MDCTEEQEGLDSRAQQCRLSSKQFARINLISRVQSTCNMGFAWTGPPPCCMDQLAPFFAWTGPPPCTYSIYARWFCHTLQVPTAPSLHLPLCLEEIFYTPLFLYILRNANYSWASQLLRLLNDSGYKGTFSESWHLCVYSSTM